MEKDIQAEVIYQFIPKQSKMNNTIRIIMGIILFLIN